MSINKYVFSNRDLCPTGEVFYCVITGAATKLPTKVIPKKISAIATAYYREGSLGEKSVTRIGSCQGVNASMHLLRILSQQVRRGIHTPGNVKMALNFAAILNFSGGRPQRL